MDEVCESERLRRLKIKLAALRRHKAAKDPLTGKSTLAVAAGLASGRHRIGDKVWGTLMALRRHDPVLAERLVDDLAREGGNEADIQGET